jgi:multicomponent Na+:H+ antiporter subunit B
MTSRRSLILQTATRYLLPLVVLYSVFLLLEGHNKPGGGFAGGLMAAAAVALCALAYDVPTARRIVRVEPPRLIGCGLLAIAVAGLWGPVQGEPFLTGLWTKLPLPGGETLELGTPLLFDVGVYVAVIGVTLMMLLTLAEEAE